MNISDAQVSALGDRLMWMTVAEWLSLAILLVFLGVLGVMALGMLKRIQALRGRRVVPMINEGKTLSKKSIAFGKRVAERGKTIATLAMDTAESLGLRAQTTANVVKGTLPEARRLPSEINATTEDLRTTLQTAEKVRSAARAVQGVKAAANIVNSLRSIVSSTRKAAQSRVETASAPATVSASAKAGVAETVSVARTTVVTDSGPAAETVVVETARVEREKEVVH